MRLVILLLALLMPAAWAEPAPDETLAAEGPALASFDDMVVVALSLIGTPYKYGGASPETGFDCSGLVQYILGLSSPIKLPRSSAEMYRMSGRELALTDLKAGDLLFFRIGKSRRINHVAVYIGENRFVHAPSSGNAVRVDPLGSEYWQKYFAGARRVLPENDKVASSR